MAQARKTRMFIPRFFGPSSMSSSHDYNQFAGESCDTFDTPALNRQGPQKKKSSEKRDFFRQGPPIAAGIFATRVVGAGRPRPTWPRADQDRDCGRWSPNACRQTLGGPLRQRCKSALPPRAPSRRALPLQEAWRAEIFGACQPQLHREWLRIRDLRRFDRPASQLRNSGDGRRQLSTPTPEADRFPRLIPPVL
jgi:hypothetical protein